MAEYLAPLQCFPDDEECMRESQKESSYQSFWQWAWKELLVRLGPHTHCLRPWKLVESSKDTKESKKVRIKVKRWWYQNRMDDKKGGKCDWNFHQKKFNSTVITCGSSWHIQRPNHRESSQLAMPAVQLKATNEGWLSIWYTISTHIFVTYRIWSDIGGCEAHQVLGLLKLP